jgi:hypothetical protein
MENLARTKCLVFSEASPPPLSMLMSKSKLSWETASLSFGLPPTFSLSPPLKKLGWEAGGGGVLYGPDEVQEWVFSWGLGEDTNNMAEALGLWQGLNQAREHGINEITVIGDSRLLIQALVTNSLPSQMKIRTNTQENPETH